MPSNKAESETDARIKKRTVAFGRMSYAFKSLALVLAADCYGESTGIQ
jgi:hypothetical protein